MSGGPVWDMGCPIASRTGNAAAAANLPRLPCRCRHLHIPLVQAERAWAYAMDLKSQLEQGGAAQKRQHLIRRLAKASRHAGELAALTAARCDARTQVGCAWWCRIVRSAGTCSSSNWLRVGTPPLQLEADAYSLWMAGSLLLEKETDWEGALARFMRAR